MTSGHRPNGAAEALPGRRMPRVLRQFLETEAAGGIVLVVAAAVALVWANSPWDGSYRALWETDLTLGLGRWAHTEDLRHWVNDALMTLFFFVVGLEIKRELVRGDLRDPRVAALPAIAALGGMVVPALLYLAVVGGSEGSRGWGIPMATDIAFAMGILALLGGRVPSALKLFLLTLAIVDDIGAIVVIAVFYAGDLNTAYLGGAVALLAAMVVLRRAGIIWMAPYLVLGAAVWVLTLASGVHATIAGVALGLITPAVPMTPGSVAREWAGDLSDEPSPDELAAMTRLAQTSVSPAERLQHQLHPWSSFLVVPVFALANAGVAIGGDGPVRVTAAVVLGLVVGKTVGITAASWLAIRLGLARLPEGVGWAMVVGTGAVAGIGFTVSLFVAELAFEAGTVQDAAKVGVLAASVLAAALGSLLVATASRRRPAA